MSTHHQRLAKEVRSGSLAWTRNVWVSNSHGMRRSGDGPVEGVVLARGFSRDLVVFIRRRRQVQRWIPRKALTPRDKKAVRA
ncbi:MAG TPA: hypothetical protein VN602_02230 [Gemmatimonadaceae bacterium]|nr:hypothetical protein [Gemmatimonadaceae bacterium]